jgi:hypothetical protein
MVLCNLLGFVLIFASALILPPFLRNMFYGGDIWADPIWFQMFMWIPFFVGISILMQRFKEQGLMLKSLSSKDLLTGAAFFLKPAMALINPRRSARESLSKSFFDTRLRSPQIKPAVCSAV